MDTILGFLVALTLFSAAGFTGECLYNGLEPVIRSLIRKERIDWRLQGAVSLWCIPVYGLSAAVGYHLVAATLFPDFFDMPWPLRGAAYVAGIYLWEMLWGLVTERVLGRCLWQYRDSRYRLFRYINPWFAPIWFGFGFILEWTERCIIPAIVGCC
ncbi:hypothetical protein AMJ57_00480 [Parcubacteria bacterium SG8_24]|nr:MAG: hypothetical protein AMJ57_00480 [Parcubacteria bacterium SG8_24]